MKDYLMIYSLLTFHILLLIGGITLFIFVFGINGIIMILLFMIIFWLFITATKDLLTGEW